MSPLIILFIKYVNEGVFSTVMLASVGNKEMYQTVSTARIYVNLNSFLEVKKCWHIQKRAEALSPDHRTLCRGG